MPGTSGGIWLRLGLPVVEPTHKWAGLKNFKSCKSRLTDKFSRRQQMPMWHAACGTWQRGHRHKIKFSYLRIILPTNKQQQSQKEKGSERGSEGGGVRQHQLLQVTNEMKSVCQRSNILFKIPLRFPLEASNLSHRKFASIFS